MIGRWRKRNIFDMSAVSIKLSKGQSFTITTSTFTMFNSKGFKSKSYFYFYLNMRKTAFILNKIKQWKH